MIIDVGAPEPNEFTIAVPGPQGPSGMVVVNHGTNGATARPAGVPVVYWIGTATPANALPYDFWYNG